MVKICKGTVFWKKSLQGYIFHAILRVYLRDLEFWPHTPVNMKASDPPPDAPVFKISVNFTCGQTLTQRTEKVHIFDETESSEKEKKLLS